MKLFTPAVENSHVNPKSRPYVQSIEASLDTDLVSKITRTFGRKRKG